jgi:hypothetical protein
MAVVRAKLQNTDGTHRCYITESEVRAGVAKGNMRRISPKGKPPVYQMVQQPDPSESNASITTITLRDMNMAVGLQRLEKGREQEDFERLVGYGLVAHTMAIPESGYLRV